MPDVVRTTIGLDHQPAVHASHNRAGANLPLVSCVMARASSPQLVAQSIHYFQRQRYPNKELIIVADKGALPPNLVPPDKEIRRLEIDPLNDWESRRLIGRREARGGLIAHWDEDYWISPDRLARQLAALQQFDAEVCGVSSLLHFQPFRASAWVRTIAGEHPNLADGSLLYRASSDPGLAGAASRVDMSDIDLVMAIVPHDTVSAGEMRGCTVRSVPIGDIAGLLGNDREFYASLRNRRSTSARVKAQLSGFGDPSGSAVNLVGTMDVATGYGSIFEFLGLGLARCGVDVRVNPIVCRRDGVTPEFREILDRSPHGRDAITLYYDCVYSHARSHFEGVSNLFFNTMWESSRLPAHWVPILNMARAIAVPTSFLVDVFRQSGVTVPLEVVAEGLDPEIYDWAVRPEHAGVHTLMITPVIPRKNVEAGVEAWKRAFQGDPNARLTIKTNSSLRNYMPDDPRITYNDTPEPTRGIARYYQQADVLLALGNEGFGLPLIEGMAMGLPVIVLDSEGQHDVCRDAAGLVLPVPPKSWTPVRSATYGDCGVRALPDIDQAVKHLRWVAEHPREAVDMGKEASIWARANRNVWQKGPGIAAVIETYTTPRRTIMRRPHFWTPSLGGRCGISEYTQNLVSAMPETVAAAESPDIASTQILHVQHEYGIFQDEPAFVDYLTTVRERGIPIVVTEHSVMAEKRPWEDLADILIAHTEQGTEFLRKKHPNRRCVHIPHGCATWFPPRKKQRGKVVGLFGFPSRYKGFHQVLAAVRSIPGAEVVAFSVDGPEEWETRWRALSEGVTVNRTRAYLSEIEIAHRLAAEADVLVYWYDNVSEQSASGAVRVGLATGVPVLTSKSRWFHDVADIVYQPDDLTAGLTRVLEDTELRDHVVQRAREYCHANSWHITAKRHREVWRSLKA